MASKPATNRSGDYYMAKVILLGDYRVGKTSLIARFCGLPLGNRVMIGCDFRIKQFDLDGKTIKFQMWEPCGGERWHGPSISTCRATFGFILVFDVTNTKSFEKLTHWIEETKKTDVKDVSIIIIGNKCDMTSHREVDYNAAKAFADIHGIPYVETSALDGQNVNIAFVRLAADIKRRIFDQGYSMSNHPKFLRFQR